MFSRLRSWLRALANRRAFRGDLEDEMAFHVDRLAEDLAAGGMDPREARRQARIRFGSAERVQAESEAMRGIGWVDELVRNVRFALRSLVRNPLLSVTFVVTLALSIGLGTAVFSVVDGILWRPLPYPDSHRLALAVVYPEDMGKAQGNPSVDGATWFQIRDGAGPFQVAPYYGGVKGVNLSTTSTSAFVRQQRIGAGFFETLGIPPFMGREFETTEDVPQGPAVSMISHNLWAAAFDSDPGILGSTILLKGEPHSVVGVMPPEFRFTGEADVWTPLRPSTTGEGGGANYDVLIRIPDGMSWQGANARFESDLPPQSQSRGSQSEWKVGLVPITAALTADNRTPLLVILWAIVAMMLVGWANLAGLQIARSLARRSEMATRKALGGGTGALVRQTVTENLLLGTLGGLGGLAVAYLGVAGLQSMVQTTFGMWRTVTLDARVLAAGIAFTSLATALFALAPVVQAARAGVRQVLVNGSRSVMGGGAHIWRKGLLVVEVAMVTTLLFASGLLVRSYGYLTDLDPGFTSEGVTTVQLSLDDARYREASRVNRLFEESIAALEDLPSVASAAVALTLPYERPLNLGTRLADSDQGRTANAVYVTSDFFETLDIPVLQGRALTTADAEGTAPVLVVNQAFVDDRMEGRQPVGSRLNMGFGGGESVEVVGVVGNVQQAGGGWGSSQPVWASPTIYLPASQASSGFFAGVHVWFSPSWLVKAAPGQVTPVAQIVERISSADPDLPIARAETLETITRAALAQPRFQASFLTLVAALALIMAGIGVYGIVAHEATERSAEMGLRMALGATPGRAVWTTGLSGLRLGIWGLVAGGVMAALVARVITHFIWGVAPYDPLTALTLVGIVIVFVAAASFLPAARIGRLDPATILRDG